MNIVNIESLCDRGLFKGVAPNTLERLAVRCKCLQLKPGTVLLAAGETNQDLYVVAEGQLAVKIQALEGAAPQYNILIGGCVGEMSLIEGRPASLSVVADVACQVLAIPQDIFWDRVVLLPGVARNLLQQFSQRLRRQNMLSQEALKRTLRLERMEQELAHARQIQMELLPQRRPLLPDHGRVLVEADIETASAVGGDLYDVIPIDAQRLGIVLGDVSGKGMPAALMMVNALTQLRLAFRKSTDLQAIVTDVNQALCRTSDASMFVSLFGGIFDQSTGQLTYVNAGHNPPVLITDRGNEWLPKACNLLLGIEPGTSFKAQSLALQPGDTLFLYTDGITDARNPAGQFCGPSGLMSFILESVGQGVGLDPQALIHNLRQQLSDFCQESAPEDDITLMALHYLKPYPIREPTAAASTAIGHDSVDNPEPP